MVGRPALPRHLPYNKKEVNSVDINAILEVIMDLAASVGIDLPALIEKIGGILAPIIEMISGLF